MNKTASQISVDELVRKAQTGDRQAFSDIVRRLMQKMTALTYKMTGDYDLAVDIAQDTFVAAWENIQSFKFEAKFESWLYRIAYNRSINALKKEGKKINDFDFEQQRSPSNPEREYHQKELKQHILAFMKTLPNEQRIVFELRFYKEMKFSEISDITQKALGTVKTNYREAVKKLRKAVLKQRWQA